MSGFTNIRGLGFVALLSIVVPACLSAQEFEPNDPCPSAQLESAALLPLSITGSLDSSESLPDVDFFRFTGSPGEALRVDLEGAGTGAGTLGDPYLGLFDADCVLQMTNDDGGSNLNSQLTLEVPADGEFVLGVTRCCDSEFLGGGEGSYVLSLDRFTTAGSISGSLADAETHSPLPGDAPPFAFAQLYRCHGSDCFEFMAVTQTDSGGGFSFAAKSDGSPLPAGAYQVQAYAQGYQPLSTAPFDVASEQHLDLGVLELDPLPFIGSVSGRLVDALDGSPLPGQAPPFAAAMLARCEEFGCFGVAFVNADEMGRFRFEGPLHQITEGDYIVIGQADGYRPGESARLTVARDEHLDTGDLSLQPIPIRFGEAHTCEIAEGQTCEYGIDISVRIARQLKVEAWSIVQYFPISAPGATSSFQVGRQGASNAKPQQLNLKPGENRTLWFQVGIPGHVPESFLVCASVFIGKSPSPQFDLLAEQPLFCAAKQAGALNLLSEKESRQALRRHQNR